MVLGQMKDQLSPDSGLYLLSVEQYRILEEEWLSEQGPHTLREGVAKFMTAGVPGILVAFPSRTSLSTVIRFKGQNG